MRQRFRLIEVEKLILTVGGTIWHGVPELIKKKKTYDSKSRSIHLSVSQLASSSHHKFSTVIDHTPEL